MLTAGLVQFLDPVPGIRACSEVQAGLPLLTGQVQGLAERLHRGHQHPVGPNDRAVQRDAAPAGEQGAPLEEPRLPPLSPQEQGPVRLLRAGPADGPGQFLRGDVDVPIQDQREPGEGERLPLQSQHRACPTDGLAGPKFFQSPALFVAQAGCLRPYIAVVPRLEEVTGEVLLPLGEAENKAVLPAVR